MGQNLLAFYSQPTWIVRAVLQASRPELIYSYQPLAIAEASLQPTNCPSVADLGYLLLWQ